VGFGLMDMLIRDYEMLPGAQCAPLREMLPGAQCVPLRVPQILIAPSWQKDNILEFCLDELLTGLWQTDCKIIIRPHPEFIKRFPGKMKQIFAKYGDKLGEKFEIQTDFSSNSTVYCSDLVITDWSSIAQEFSFTTKKPSLFLNTPMKIMNPEWQKIGIEPMEIWIRDRIGVSLEISDLGQVATLALDLLAQADLYRDKISAVMSEYLYNPGTAAEVGGQYLITQCGGHADGET
jgi:YidC/Oxa1 family membrane protein insertase